MAVHDPDDPPEQEEAAALFKSVPATHRFYNVTEFTVTKILGVMFKLYFCFLVSINYFLSTLFSSIRYKNKIG